MSVRPRPVSFKAHGVTVDGEPVASGWKPTRWQALFWLQATGIKPAYMVRRIRKRRIGEPECPDAVDISAPVPAPPNGTATQPGRDGTIRAARESAQPAQSLKN